jgi:hypothetical protein
MAFATIGTRGIQAQSVDLSSKVTGTLPVPNGGLGIASGTTGQFLKFSGTETLASSAIGDTGKVLQVKTAYGGTATTVNTTSNQLPINSNFYATITPTTVGNKFIMYGTCDLNYENAGTYHDVGFCYSTDGGSNYVDTNMSGKAAKGYYTGVTRLEGTFEFTTGELTTSSANAHRISFNGLSGNGACQFMANSRSSIIIMEIAV